MSEEVQCASSSSEESPQPCLIFEIPREFMKGISVSGGAFSHRQEPLQAEAQRNKQEENANEDAVIAFRNVNLQGLFNKMSADLEKINGDLDEKDEMLALLGLVRPEIRRVLQRCMRRLAHGQQPEGEAGLGRLQKRRRTEVLPNATDECNKDGALPAKE